MSKKVKGEKNGPVPVEPVNRIRDLPEKKVKPELVRIAIVWNRETGGFGVDASGFLSEVERFGFVRKFCNAEMYERILAAQREKEAAQDNGKETG